MNVEDKFLIEELEQRFEMEAATPVATANGGSSSCTSTCSLGK